MTDIKGNSSVKALAEFLSEAQDLVEGLGRNLILADQNFRRGEQEPEIINDLFRGMHTLKSLSGMFGVDAISKLAHHEENLLDEIRLGRIGFDQGVLDLLFESVELVTRVLAAISEGHDPSSPAEMKAIDNLILRLDRGTEPSEAPSSLTKSRDPKSLLGPEILEVLTEYEEHRLRTNLDRGLPLFRVHAWFDLSSIDVDLEDVKQRLKPVGEIITYLPATDEIDPNKLAIDILLASRGEEEQLRTALEGLQAEVIRLLPLEPGTDFEARRTTPPPAAYSILPAESPLELQAPSAAEQGLSVRSFSQTVRVDIRKLDRLMNVVGELAIVRSAISRISEELSAIVGRRDLAIELHRINRGFERRLSELREGILEVRMVPLSQMFDRLARMVRKISRDLGKDIQFVISGADTEVDKLIIEELSDPIIHIIRNSIDHGIEGADTRAVSGKPNNGTVALTAYQKGSHVVIEIEDDGAGIDGERLIDVALDRGFLTAEMAELLSPRDVLNLVFVPGLSTAEETTTISGRGVGMDIVKTNIASLGGVVELQSELGIGTKFTITLPVTLAIIPALLVNVADGKYALPLNTVTEALLFSSEDVTTMLGSDAMTLRGQTLPLCRLDSFFGLVRGGPIPAGSCVVVIALGQRRLGLVVDTLLGQQDVVIKTLGKSLGSGICFSGATDLGDERLALVIDPASVIEQYFRAGDGLDHRFVTTGGSA